MTRIRKLMTVVAGLAVSAGMPFDATAQIVDRGTLPGGTGCSATSVNSNGTLIGVCSGSHASGGHAVGVYQLRGDAAPTSLPVLAAGKWCNPVAISDTGTTDFVAGSCEDAAGDTRAVRWVANGQGRFVTGPQALMPLQGLVGLGADIEASVASVSKDGAVAGDSIGATNRHRAVIWQAGSTVATLLPDPPAPLLAMVSGCSAFAMNNAAPSGVAGTCQIVNGGNVSDVAVRWAAGAGGFYAASVLGDIGGGHCGAVGINLGGDTVGLCSDPDGDATAILWASNTVQPLVIVAADQSMVASINDKRVVAGSYITDDGYLHTYVGTPLTSNVLFDIGTLAGGHNCGVAGLDGAGNVVATCDTGTRQALAARYGAGRGLEALGTLGGPSSGVTGISIGGMVVGNSTTANGYSHAFIAAPVAPAAAWDGGGLRTVPVGGARATRQYASASTGSDLKDHPNCASWVANGFATSSFYTDAQKRQYCPLSTGLANSQVVQAQAPVPQDRPECTAWIANGFLANTFYSEAQKKQYCPASFAARQTG
jgi:probable HAF family extracellular repeat protein